MKAVLYGLLLALVLWAGFAVNQAHMPAPAPTPVAEVPVQEEAIETAEEASVASAPERAVQEAPAVVQPGPLVSSPPPPAPAPEPKPVVYDQQFVATLEQAIHDRTNAERARAGLAVLRYDDALAQVAAEHSTDMAVEDYFAHEDEDGCTAPCRLNEAHYQWRAVGENLFLLRSGYRYTVEEASAIIVAGWMGSDGHRENLLYEEFAHEGLGVVVRGDSLYATQVFSLPR